MVAPFGVLASTALLVYLTEPEAEGFREFVRAGRDLVDLGAVVYAAAVVSAERGVAVIFWALEQRKKYIAERIAHNERVTALWREEGREKGRTEGKAQGRAEGRAEAFAEIRAMAQAEANPDLEAIIDQVMKENGIDPTPPQNGASA
jgi:flagellar biosynthesis/type III secretory pathway protein FliH